MDADHSLPAVPSSKVHRVGRAAARVTDARAELGAVYHAGGTNPFAENPVGLLEDFVGQILDCQPRSTRLAFVWAGSPVTALRRDEQILVLAPLNPASAIERVEHCTFTEPPLADDIVVDAELLGNGQKDARA